MAKVIVERPRHGGREAKGYARRVRSRESGYDLPKCEGTKRPYGSDAKELNENLAPLYRYLDRQVDRPWDKVYADIRARINSNSAVQLHILQHVKHHVEVHPVEQDGKVGTLHRYRDDSGFAELWDGDLYVHPRTGLLRRYKRRPSATPSAPTTHILIDAAHEYQKHRGVWYWVELTPIDPTHRWSPHAHFDDVLLGVRSALQLYAHYERRHYYATGKRQLNKQAIREMKRRYLVVK
jgi:hypothetical protein